MSEKARVDGTEKLLQTLTVFSIGIVFGGVLQLLRPQELRTLTCGSGGVGSSSWSAPFEESTAVTVNGISYIKGGDGQLYLKTNKEQKLGILSSGAGGVVVENDSAIITATVKSGANGKSLSIDATCN